MLSRCVAGFNTEKKSNQFYTQKIQPPKLEDMGALLKSKGGISMKTAEYDVQDGWIVSDYPECTSLKIEAWMPLLDYQGEWEESR